MGTVETPSPDERWVDVRDPAEIDDLPMMFDKLQARLREPSVQERWYPGSSTGRTYSELPYYRVADASSLGDLLEAALARPPGIRFDLEDWSEAFAYRSRIVRQQIEARSVARHLRIALAGGIAGGALALGLCFSVLSLLSRPYRPDPPLALALVLSGIVLAVTTTAAIKERGRRRSVSTA